MILVTALILVSLRFAANAACSGTPPSPIVCDNANDTVTVSGSQTITIGLGFAISGGHGDNSITNNGLLETTLGTAGFAVIDVRSGADTVTNNGTVQGLIYAGVNNDQVTNTGLIRDGIVGADGNDLIVNSGTINGTVAPGGSGSESGIVQGDGGAPGFSGNDTIVNTGVIANGAGTLYTVNAGPGNDSINNSGTINGVVFGNTGDDTIVNAGLATGAINGGTGADSIVVNGGAVASGGIVADSGNDSVTINGGGIAHFIDGGADNDVINNAGGVNTSIQGGVGNDLIINQTGVGATATDLLGGSGNDTITNGGTVYLNIDGGVGADSIVNFTGGSISNAYGLTGNDTITNGGTVLGEIRGGDDNDIIVNVGGALISVIGGDFGDDSIVNNGSMVLMLYGGPGNDTIRNNGLSAGAVLGDGDDLFENTSSLTGGGGVNCGAGNDTAILGGTINSNVFCETGNDSVVIAAGWPANHGASITGTIDGGAGTDTLTFSFTVTASELAAFNAVFPTLLASGGTVTIAGRTYTWVNFEQLINLLSAAPEPAVVTITLNRRLNFTDVAAPVALYCEAGGVDVWTVGASGVGSFAFSVSYAEVNAGTSYVAGGVTFVSYPGGSFSVSAVGHDGKPYTFTGRCS
ncbi:MAG: beta strand repeat-containing protein [Candidatus Flexifilum sp.]